MATVVAERVDVPPAVTVRGYGRVEGEAVAIARAAKTPLVAAIGTPAPG
jgi:hypothetical protein